MKTVLLFLLLASPAYAQTQEAVNAALFGCGPANVKFDVKESAPQPESAIEPGKALVYVIEDMGQAAEECVGGCAWMASGSAPTRAIPIFRFQFRRENITSARIGNRAFRRDLRSTRWRISRRRPGKFIISGRASGKARESRGWISTQ